MTVHYINKNWVTNYLNDLKINIVFFKNKFIF